MPKNIRLGQRMEYFMEAALNAHPSYKIIAKNLQIIPDKITLGELDFLIKDLILNEIVHLEMAYKFYLYDPLVSHDWSKCWIGTDRGDSLYLKIQKLKSKQLPLLHQQETKPYLNDLNIGHLTIQQRVCLKGQFFLPYGQNVTVEPSLNEKAIAGHWLHTSDLVTLKGQQYFFYIPKKNKWVEALRDTHVKWLSYDEGIDKMNAYLENNYGAMLWIKAKNKEIKRLMVVKWD